MQYVSHEFISSATPERARYWLTQLGFEPYVIEVHTHGVPRVSLPVKANQVAAVELLFHALDLADQDGQQGPDKAATPSHEGGQPKSEHGAPIGWHPLEEKNPPTGDRPS